MVPALRGQPGDGPSGGFSTPVLNTSYRRPRPSNRGSAPRRPCGFWTPVTP